MTSLLSAISGHFNRSLIFVPFVPVVTFLTLGGWLLQSWLPGDPPWQVLAGYGAEWQAVAAFLAVALGSGVLYSINVPLTRVYEGYPWEDRSSAAGAQRNTGATGVSSRRGGAAIGRCDTHWKMRRARRRPAPRPPTGPHSPTEHSRVGRFAR